MQIYRSLLETTLNTRDLGGYETRGGKCTSYDVFLRSDEVLKPSQKDIDYLLTKGITTIIDMREKVAARKRPSPFAHLDFSYFHIPIEEGSKIPACVQAVPESYMEIVKAKHMNEVFRRLACAPHGALFHCSAGKDRTVVVSAILLLLAEVKEEEIVKNYRLTKFYNQRRFAWAKKNLPDIDIQIILPKEAYMIQFLHLFCKSCGNAQRYLKEIGISNEEIRLLKNKLL